MRNEVSDCHQQALEAYKLKGAAYATQPDRAYELDPSDVDIFRLNGGARTTNHYDSARVRRETATLKQGD